MSATENTILECDTNKEIIGINELTQRVEEFNQIILAGNKIKKLDYEDFLDTVFLYKENLKDAEYMNIMEKLSEMLPNINSCICAKPDEYCLKKNIFDFLNCVNYSEFIKLHPIIKLAAFLFKTHPNYSATDFKRIAKQITPKRLVLESRINPNITLEELSNNIQYMINLTTMEHHLLFKRVCIFEIYKYILENIPQNMTGNFQEQIYKFLTTIYNKLDEYIQDCNEPICGQLKRILGWQKNKTCPFKDLKHIMSTSKIIMDIINSNPT